MAVAALFVVAGYLLGTMPTAVMVARRRGHDPTAEGSGNPGASNVYRTAGRRAGAFVLLGDLGKGVVAAGAGRLLDAQVLAALCGAAAVAGHVLPVTRGFRGGKGAATFAGAALVVQPVVGLAAAAGWALVTLVGRRPSLASVGLAIAVPLAVAAVGAPAAVVAAIAAAGGLVLVRHAANIGRLLQGAEAPIEARRR